MSNIQEVLDSQKRIEGIMLSKMSEFQKQLQSTAPDSKPNLDKLTQDFYEFKKFVSSMFSLMNTQIQSLSTQLDGLDNQQRRNALLFSGIRETDKEDCTASILDIINTKLNLCNIQAESIYLCHRLGSKSANRNRPIIVRFTNIHTRNTIWREKKLLKTSSVVISEFLTRTRQAIFSAARKHFGMTCCWSQDGNIFVKLPDGDRKRVTSMQDLEHLNAKYPLTTTSNISTTAPKAASTLASTSKGASSCQPAAPAVVPEPPLTRRNVSAKGKHNK